MPSTKGLNYMQHGSDDSQDFNSTDVWSLHQHVARVGSSAKLLDAWKAHARLRRLHPNLVSSGYHIARGMQAWLARRLIGVACGGANATLSSEGSFSSG